MYAHVIPLDTSLGTSPLTYAVRGIFQSTLQPGMLVTIPFGKKIIQGIVESLASSHSQKHFVVKDIINIELPYPLVTPYQLLLIRRITQKYLIPIHKVIRILLPQYLIRRLQKYHPQELYTEQGPTHTSPQKHALYISQNHTVTYATIAPYISSDRTAIIVPDDIFLLFFTKNMQIEKEAILYTDATDTKKAKSWIDVCQGKYPIIIGTRRILYYNLLRYSHIVYVEDSFFSEYFHYPIHIQYRDILSYLLEIPHFSLSIFTSVPQLTTLSQFHHFPIHHLSS